MKKEYQNLPVLVNAYYSENIESYLPLLFYNIKITDMHSGINKQDWICQGRYIYYQGDNKYNIYNFKNGILHGIQLLNFKNDNNESILYYIDGNRLEERDWQEYSRVDKIKRVF